MEQTGGEWALYIEMKGKTMKRLHVFLLVISLLITGCSFDVQVMDATPTAPALESRVEVPIFDPLSVTSTPDVGPLPPLFSRVYFSTDPTQSSGISSFPTGTKQIFAVWDYQNMQDGMVVSREWYLDGKLWLTREENWDFAKYGSSGTMRDISIYDFNVGLPSGVYQLKLSINGMPQPIGVTPTGQGQNWQNFDIKSVTNATQELASPDWQWSVYIYDNQRIVLRDVSGTPKDVFTGKEINYLNWFNDSKHFIFVDRDYSGQQPGSPIGIRDDLYIFDMASGQVTLLYKNDHEFKGYGGPMPSPSGQYIAGLEGSGFGDACFVDSSMVFFQLNADLKSVTVLKQEQFSGIPSATDSTVYPVQEGSWQSDTQYLVTLKGTCGIDQSLMGEYLFDVPSVSTTRK